MKTVEYIVFFSLLVIPTIFAIIYWAKPETTPADNELLKCESPIERRLYKGLTQHMLFPVTQYPAGKFRIDIAFPGHRLAIEADGKAFQHR
ncbi:hypothetical protein [Virgibacillus sp. L01]|uniref:hypothetical protein n=1 Tax=Virgibacillus sp. L01 TaxID=3457429 RepID=UPI003FD14891